MELYPIDLAIHLVNLVVLFLILRALLFNPVRKFLSAREARVAAELQEAADKNAQAEALKADYAEKLSKAEEECQAIFSHTTGRPGMTAFDKILYLADYMEPTRDFDGVEELRRLVWEDLDRAMILGLEMSVEDLEERGVPVHPDTLGILEELRRKTR